MSEIQKRRNVGTSKRRNMATVLAALLLAVSGLECPAGGPVGVPAGFPRTTPWMQRTISGTAGVTPAAATTADFDDDGLLDVAVAYAGFDMTPANIVIFFQTDIDTFQPVQLFATGASVPAGTDIVAADINVDTRLDLVLSTDEGILYAVAPINARQGGNWSGFIINESDGDELTPWRDVAVANLDGDNGPDIIATGGATGRVSWFISPARNVSDGNAWTRVDIDATDRDGAESIALTNLNNDVRNDVVSSATSESTERIVWYQQPVNPATDAWQRFPIGNLQAASALALGDLNVDGRTDVVAVNTPGGQVAWYVQPQDPTMAWEGFVLADYTSARPLEIAITDVDTNGQPDVIATTETPGSLRWFTPALSVTDLWIENNLANTTGDVVGIALGDVDADGDQDVVALLIGATAQDDAVVWLQNPE